MLRHIFYLVVTLFMLTGCRVDELYDQEITVGEVQTLYNGIAIHRTDEDAVYYLDASVKSPKINRTFIAPADERIVWYDKGPNPTKPKSLFVLTEPLDLKTPDGDERLYRIDVETKKTTKYTVGARFDKLVFGPNQQFAILYHSGNNTTEEGFYNPNEIALLDLSKKPGKTNPQSLTVSMEGRKIDRVEFIPSIHIGGEERELVVFMAGSVVRIVDLQDPEHIWAKVLLSNVSNNMVPQKLIAVDETDECTDAVCQAKLFIQTTASEDVFYITLGTSGDGFEGIKPHQLEAGGTPLDIAMVTDGEIDYLASLSQYGANSQITFVNTDTSAAFSIIIDNDKLTKMQVVTDEERSKLAIFGTSGYNSVHFLDLADLAVQKGRNLESIAVQGGVSTTLMLEGDRLLIIPWNNSDMMILDLHTEQGNMLSASGEYDWTNAQVYNDVFFVLPNTTGRVDFVDIQTGRPDSLILDDEAKSLHIIPGRKTGVVFHSATPGRATLFPLSNPSRGAARIFDGFWLTHVFDIEEVE